MLNKIFDPDNFVFRMLARGVDIVGLSICWAMLCLPIVTAGPATAALYYTMVKVFRQKEEGAFGLFFRSFVGALKTGIPLTVLCEAVGVVLAFGYSVMANNISTGSGVIMYMAYYVALVVPIGMACYLFPMLGRFDMKLGALLRTSIFLTLRHLFSTIVQVLLVLEVAVFIINNWWPVLFCPALLVLLLSLFQEKIYAKYLTEEQREALNPNLQQEEAEMEERRQKREARKRGKENE